MYKGRKIKALICIISIIMTLFTGATSVYAYQSAYGIIEGESWNSMSGVVNITGAVGFIENNDWVKYTAVDFGSRGTTGFQANYASGASGGNIEIWIDSLSGTKIGQLTVPTTGSWSTWEVMTASNLTLTTGTHDVYLKFTGAEGFFFDIDWIKFSETIEAENMTLGGNPVPNTGTWVPGFTGTGFVQEFREHGQYVSVTFNAPVSGIYDLTYRYDTIFNNATRCVYINDRLTMTKLEFLKTCEDWSAWGTNTISLYLNSGSNTIKLYIDKMYNSEWNTVYLDNLTIGVANVGQVYNGTKNIPGIVHAEDFNSGLAGFAYYDASSGNYGGVYRSTDVDISASVEGGYEVAWGENGDWLNYTVNALSTGFYGIKIRAATPYDGITIDYYADGVKMGTIPITKTANHDAFCLSSGSNFFLTSGIHVVKIKINRPLSDNVDIDYINIGKFPNGFSSTFESESGTLGGSPAPTASSTSHQEYRGTGFVEYFYRDGQYAEVTANVPLSGKYMIDFRYTAPIEAKRAVYVNGTRVSSNFTFPSTVNYDGWHHTGLDVQLNAGDNTVRCVYEASSGSMQYINLDNITARYLRSGDPYPGSHNIPGTVQFEDYDTGGSGVAYNDSATGNQGGQYRSDDVDIGYSAGPGYYVNYINQGDWMKYTVEVGTTQNYNMTMNVASPYTEKKISISVDDKEIGDFAIVNTGSYATWQTMDGPQNLLLTKGTHEIKFRNISDNMYYDLNWFALSPSFTITPGIVTPASGFTPNDVIVKTVSVTEYGALAGSDNDATAAFQNALDTVGALGGGVVFVPSGTYRLNGHINIPNSVTLRGEWKSPENGGLGIGTILKAYENKDNEVGRPFITMNMSSGLKNMGIWYPEQEYNNVHAYPYTIQGSTKIDDDVVFNVTLYNSYNGIRLGQEKTGNGRNVFKNVYGTVLKTGIWQDNNFDTLRFENINFGILYWANSGLEGAPSSSGQQDTLKAFTRANTVGFDLGRIDWAFIYDISLSDMLTGVKCRKGDYGDGNFSISQFNITSVNIGMDVQNLIGAGLQASEGIINASVGTDPTGLMFSAPNTCISFSNTIFGGTPHTCIKVTGDNSVLSLNNVTFGDWGYSGGTYAIDSQKGSVVVEKCNFQQNKQHINLSSGNTGALILSNMFSGGAQITNNSSGSPVINHGTLAIPTVPAFSYTFTTERKPANTTNFYNVRNSPYNAAGDGVTDDTSAIQSALTAAGNAGGGTVYLPAGSYKVATHLTVPAGVELRGASETIPHGGVMSGTEIRAFEGKDNANGTPLISLSSNAGIRGINIYYPEQDFTIVHAYPWAVRGMGSGCWVYNCSFVNAYQGVDMLTNQCENNMITSNTGFAFNCAFQIGNNITSGFFEDNMFNPNAWFNGDRPGTPRGYYTGNVLYPYLHAYATGVKLGRCTNYNSFTNFFIFMNTTYKFIDDAGGSYSGTIFLPGTDVCWNGLVVEKGGTINVHHYMGANPFTEANIALFKTTSTFSGTLNVYNSAVWGGINSKVANINGGTVNITQLNNGDDTNIKVNAGTFKACGVVSQHFNIPTSTNDFEFGSGITSATLLGNISRGTLNVTDNSGGKLSSSNNSTY